MAYSDRCKKMKKNERDNDFNETAFLDALFAEESTRNTDTAKALFCSGLLIIDLLIVYVLLPIFVQHWQPVPITVLLVTGILTVLFVYLNHIKYGYMKFFKPSGFFTESFCVLLGLAIRYFCACFLYHDTGTINLVEIGICAVLLVPFIITNQLISKEYNSVFKTNVSGGDGSNE